jgi:magnesium chelatase family protein
MVIRLLSALLSGIDALPCEVEVDLDRRWPRQARRSWACRTPAVRESLERVRSALGNGGYAFPNWGRTADQPRAGGPVGKEGPVYDLPIAVGLMLAPGVGAAAASPRRWSHVAWARTMIVG